MSSESTAKANPMWMTLTGWVLTLLPAPLLLFSSYTKITRHEMAVKGFADFGYPDESLQLIGFVELACTILYVAPHTSILGATLLTGYLGGATATHVHHGDPFFAPVIFGVVLWLGIFFREPRLRALTPWRT